MALLFKPYNERIEPWLDRFAEELPDLDVRVWPDVGDPGDIEYALVWMPEPGDLKRYPNLRAIFSIAAGIDHLLRDPCLPKDIPVTRVVDPQMARYVAEYVLAFLLVIHRQLDTYRRQQCERVWQEHAQPPSSARRVGIMGLGQMGAETARLAALLGFETAGWSRGRKDIENVRSFAGPEELVLFLGRSDILVCLLPLTPATAGILNRETLSALPEGAYLIQAGRGEHLVEEDLLAVLDSGRLAGAVVDVFRTEPLPRDHPFWSHPRITVTPHAAAQATPDVVLDQVIENIRRDRSGRPLEHVVDLARGY